MYFKNRNEAGLQLAATLGEKYRYEDCAVIALNDGAVMVAEPIAAELHSVLTMLLIENIEVPGEGLSIGGLSQAGAFTYNGMLSAGEVEGYRQEFFGYFEEQKREAMGRINRLLGDGGLIDKDLLRGRNIILVSDGFADAASLDVALDFLKPIKTKKLIIATPTASVPAVDRLHLFADELQVLDVKANFMGVNHYYDENDIPTHEETVKKINDIILNWR
ncbi:MAG: phosphoribosyltransferase [Candidatus Saccharimonadales bacterium]